MHLKAKLICSTLMLSASLFGCSNAGGGVSLSVNPPSQRSAATVPGFFLGNPGTFSFIAEYAQDATFGSAALRTIEVRGAIFGVDRLGNIYTYTEDMPPYSFCIAPCTVTVYSYLGKRVRTMQLPAAEYAYVDGSGNVYAVIAIRHKCGIVEYRSGDKGVSYPERTIAISLKRCEGSQVYVARQQWRLYADDRGRVYFMSTPLHAGTKLTLYSWPPGAHGAAKPDRVITSRDMLSGVQGTYQGNVWFTAGDASYFSPTNSGPNPSGTVALPSPGARALVLSSSGQLVYLTYNSQSPCLLVVRPIGSAEPTQQINVTGRFCERLYQVTF